MYVKATNFMKIVIYLFPSTWLLNVHTMMQIWQRAVISLQAIQPSHGLTFTVNVVIVIRVQLKKNTTAAHWESLTDARITTIATK